MNNAYDEWKLSSPDERELCRECDGNLLLDMASEAAQSIRKDIEPIFMGIFMNNGAMNILEPAISKIPKEYRPDDLKQLISDELTAFEEGVLLSIMDDLEEKIYQHLSDSASLCRSCHDLDHADDRY